MHTKKKNSQVYRALDLLELRQVPSLLALLAQKYKYDAAVERLQQSCNSCNREL